MKPYMKIPNHKPDSLLPGIPGRKELRNPSKDSGRTGHAPMMKCYYLLYGKNNRPEYLNIPTLLLPPPKNRLYNRRLRRSDIPHPGGIRTRRVSRMPSGRFSCAHVRPCSHIHPCLQTDNK